MKIKTRRYYIYYFAKIFFFCISLVPRCVSLVIADFLGKIAFKILGKYRKDAISNLDEVFSFDRNKNVEIAEGVFRNLAKNGAEWIKLMTIKKEKIEKLVTETHGFEYLTKAIEKGKGVILLASHFGNWELIAIYLGTKGYKGAIIGRRIYFYKYDKLITKLRDRFGAKVIYRDESPKKMLRVLKNGEILGILADQDVDSIDGVFVDFFGKAAYTPTAPIKLAMVSGAEIIPTFMIRKSDNTYKWVLEKPIVAEKGEDKEKDVKEYTQAWTKVLEEYVRKYPEQWVWLHSRWKTKKVHSV